jgi:hypothetical protein
MSTSTRPPTSATPASTLRITPWRDDLVDRLGHDPRSRYVERFWLGILGPSTTLFLRHLAGALDDAPDGFDLDLDLTAEALGLGGNNRRSQAFTRAITRSVDFKLTRREGRHGLQARRHLPPLTQGQLARLPDPLRQAHERWQSERPDRAAFDQAQDRARRLALSLFEMGCELDQVERELHRWHHHPALASAAANWARDRHVVARRAAHSER